MNTSVPNCFTRPGLTYNELAQEKLDYTLAENARDLAELEKIKMEEEMANTRKIAERARTELLSATFTREDLNLFTDEKIIDLTIAEKATTYSEQIEQMEHEILTDC